MNIQFSCTQENLHRGLSLVSHVTSKASHLPILHNVLIEAKEDGVLLSATNLEIALRVHVRAKVDAQGSFTVPAQVIAQYVALLTDERVDITQEEKTLKIQSGMQKTKIHGEGSEEFPIIPAVEAVTSIVVSRQELDDAVRQVLVALSKDNTRTELTGIVFQFANQAITLASTDGHRLVERVITAPHQGEVRARILPGSTMQELSRILSFVKDEQVEMHIGENQIQFVVGDVELSTRVIEGVFPDYRQIMPTVHRTRVIVKKEVLVQAVKSSSLFSKSGIYDVNMHFSQEKQEVTLTTVNMQLGENVTKITAEIIGESNHTILNYRYLIDAVATMNGDVLCVDVIDNMSPVLVRPMGDQSYTYIIMPIRQ